jgi:hypothetical protein
MKRTYLISLVVLASLSVPLTLNAQSSPSPTERQKSKIIKKIQALNPVQVYSDNSQGAVLFIQDARVKEISGDDFTILAGETAKHFRLSSFPEVTLVNTSGKTIKSFGIAVQSAADKPKSGYILLKSNLSIHSNSTYKVNSTEWPKAEMVSAQKGGKFVSGLRQPGMDSPKSWIPGAAPDLKVTIGFVEFEDGTRWMISRDSGL